MSPETNKEALYDLILQNGYTLSSLKHRKQTQILITQDKIEKIIEGPLPNHIKGKKTIQCHNKLIHPGLINSHTHAGMSLFRGYGDDLPLKEWLEDKIWPSEAKLTEEICYWGNRLAIAEMIKTGTTCFNDMYFFPHISAKAAKDAGVRAQVAAPIIKFMPEPPFKKIVEDNFNRFQKGEYGPQVKISLGPHAPYSVSFEDLQWSAHFAKTNDLPIHIHMAENEWEIAQCKDENKGLTPIRLLEETGILECSTILAHSIWLDEEDLVILQGKKVSAVHCPVSNMKLTSGGKSAQAFPYHLMKKMNINMAIGTDGQCSNNNLNLFEEMKFASLLAKHSSGDPTALNASEVLEMATVNGAKALGYDNLGQVKENYLADLIIMDLNELSMVPLHQIHSNLIYSMPADAIETVICAGNIVMENKIIPEIEEIKKRVTHYAQEICQ